MSGGDFRSDTVTLPTPAMREAMASAEVGDDVLDGDPTVRALEERAAAWLGKDGALFVPSGTMGNQVCIGSWTSHGGELIALRDAHIVDYEAGAIAALHGVQTMTLTSTDGCYDLDELRASLRAPFVHSPVTQLVCVEQTHMSSGGRVVPLAHLESVREIARERGLPVHMDGARLANAVVASGLPAATFGACADSITFCLSKGLGAPVGSVLAGLAEFLERARAIRKRLGGWMRQSGILAAAGLLALGDGLARLAEDHALALRLAEALRDVPGLACRPVETNLVLVDVAGPAGEAERLVQKLAAGGIRASSLGPGLLRFVTHRDVGAADVARLHAILHDEA